MLRNRSIRFRLTVWYATVLTAGLGLFGALLFGTLQYRLGADIRQDLDGWANRFQSYFLAESQLLSGQELRDELDEFCQAVPAGSYIDLRSDASSFRCPAGPSPAGEHRIATRRFAANGQSYRLEVGKPVGDVLRTLSLLRWLLLSLIPVVIAIACVGGAWLSRRALKPVQDVTAAAHTVSIENLSGRLPVPATGDEIARLTEVLNTMLGRLESAVQTLSQFAADASHELRTPLAVIRATAESALRRERSPESYRESLQDIAAEAQQMTRLIEDLLVLARSGTAMAEMPRQPIDLRDVVQKACAEVRPIAQSRQVTIQTVLSNESAIVSGNPPALHRLLLVLLDNAVKYSHAGADIVVAIQPTAGQIVLTVRDFGRGISQADLPHIFKRFYRAGPSRSGEGHGLGLSLAESIARAHDATIEAESTEGAGAMFRVIFPQRPVTPDPSSSPAQLLSESSASRRSL